MKLNMNSSFKGIFDRTMFIIFHSEIVSTCEKMDKFSFELKD